MTTNPNLSGRRLRDQLWTAPNLITALRLLVLAPLFVVLLLVFEDSFWALLVAVILGGTDWVDGYVARRFGQVTDLGRALDPIADRLSQITVAVAMVLAGLIPLWMVILVAGADIILGAALLLRRPGVIPVRWVGRIRTALLMVGLPLVLAVDAFAPGESVLVLLALIVVGAGVVLHVIADLLYTVSLLRGTAHEHTDAHPDLTSPAETGVRDS